MTRPCPTDRRRRALLLGAPAALLLGALPLPALAGETPLRIGIIGAGRIGGTLARLWAEAGHEVFLSSRNPDNLFGLAADIGARAQVGTPAEAAEFGDVILVSVPYGALPQIGEDYGALMAGKIVLETGNPQAHRDGDMANAARAEGTGVASARYLPGVRLVRAFTSVPATRLRSDAHREPPRIGIPLAADDPVAMEMAVRLTREAGFDPVVVGDLSRARDFDIGTPLFARAMTADEVRAALGL